MHCPACGVSLDADERFAHLVTCPWCHSSFILDEHAARVTGEMAVLPPTPSPFVLGATGRIMDRAFTIVGRVRYGWGQGYWDEWFLGFEDGSMAWISEDEGNFTLESWSEATEAPIEYADATPGGSVTIGSATFHIDEKNVARCEGGEGQLPFEVAIGEEVPYLDLSSDDAFATVEYDPDGVVRTFIGRRLDLSEVKIDVAWMDAGAIAADTLDRTAGGTRIVKSGDRALRIQCDSCGSTLSPPKDGAEFMECPACATRVDLTLRRVPCPQCDATVTLFGGDEAKSAACRKCGGHVDVSGSTPALVARLVSDRKRPRMPLKLGQQGTLRGVDYRVVGYMRLHEKEEGTHYFSNEFLLHSDKGYRWLVMENRHFSLCTELDVRPLRFHPKNKVAGSRFTFNDRRWRIFESGKTDIVWVEGEFPWVAKLGDTNHYMDAVSPPYMLSAEWTRNEMEWIEAEYIPQDEIVEAFKIDAKRFRKPAKIAPNQPYPTTRFRKQAQWIMLAMFVLNLLLALFVGLPDGDLLTTLHVSGSEYGEEFLTEPFEITKANALVRARFEAPVDNSWVYVDGAVINDKDEALLDLSAEMSYYHGYSGGESWSEGSKDDAVTFKLKEPGSYRFLLKGEAGDTGYAFFGRKPDGPDLSIKVFENPGILRWFVILSSIGLTWCLVEWIRKWAFETERWGESDVEDD